MRYILTHRSTLVYLFVLIFLSIALWIPRLRGPIDLRYDAGVYYILGASLVQGKGYRLLNEPGEIQAIQYPPLLPLFAAIHQRLAGSGDPSVAGHWLRISYFMIFLVFVFAVYWLSRHYLKPGAAFLATLVVLLHVHTTWMSELFFAELPFALTSVLFLLVTLHCKNRSKNLLAGLLGAVSFLLRSAGIALLIAWIGESLLQRRFREMALRAALALIPVLAWQAYIAHVKGGPEYLQTSYEYQRAGYQFYNVGYLENMIYIDSFAPELGKASSALFLKRISSNLMDIPRTLGAAVSVDPEWIRSRLIRLNKLLETIQLPIWLAEVPFVVLGSLVLFGLVLLVRRGERLIILYLAGSVVLICLTPWPGQFIRYIWPVAPLLAIAFFNALVTVQDYLSSLVSGRWRRPGFFFIAAIMFGLLSAQLIALGKIYEHSSIVFYETPSGQQRKYRLLFYGGGWQAWKLHDAVLDWLGREASLGEIIATSTPHRVYLKTGLMAVMPPFEPNPRVAQRLIDSVPVNYFIIDSLQFVNISRRYGVPIVQAFPERWELIYSSGKRGSRIYRRVTPPSGVKYQ